MTLAKFLALSFCVLVGVSLCACGQAPDLRTAQAAFNDAAAADNASRFAPFTAPSSEGKNTATSTLNASAGYAIVITQIDKLDQKKLQDDKLLGVALALKTMSQWKLRTWDDAAATARTLGGLDDTQVFPRDRAIAKAMPALIRIDQAHDAIFDPKALALTADQRATYKSAQIAQLDVARGLLDGVLASATQADPVTLYLLEAELGAFRNKQDALLRLRAGTTVGADDVLSDAERKLVRCRMGQLVDGIKRTATDTEAQQVGMFWSAVLGPQVDITACASL